MTRATVRHILVDGETRCRALIEEIRAGADFATLARRHSRCPSARDGGALGSVGRGQTVPAFDRVCFEGEVGAIQGPIRTQFGYHALEVLARE